MCEDGTGMQKNVDTAFRYYRLAVEQADTQTHVKMARIHIKGTVVSTDFNRAAFYLRLLEKSQWEGAKKDASLLRRPCQCAAAREMS